MLQMMQASPIFNLVLDLFTSQLSPTQDTTPIATTHLLQAVSK